MIAELTTLPPMDRSQWKRVSFGDVVRCVDKTRRDPTAEGLTRVVGLEHLDPGELKISRWADVADGTSFTRVFRAGHVLFGKRRAYQRKAALADFDGICSGDILVFEADSEKLSPDLLPFIVQSQKFVKFAIATSAGSLSPRTKWKDLKDCRLYLPSEDEQARVTALFSALEAVREHIAHAYGQAVKLREKDFSARLGIDGPDTAILEYEGREWVPAHSVCESIVSGYTPKEMSEGGGEVRFLKVYNLSHDGSLDVNNRPVFIKRDTHEGELGRSAVKPGDVLTNIVGPPLGKVSVIPPNVLEANINQAIVAFRPKAGVSSRLISAYLLREQTRRWLYSRGKKTSGQLNITRTTCRNMPFPSVLLDQRQAFGIDEALEKHDAAVEALHTHMDRLDDLKSALSQMFFSEEPSV